MGTGSPVALRASNWARAHSRRYIRSPPGHGERALLGKARVGRSTLCLARQMALLPRTPLLPPLHSACPLKRLLGKLTPDTAYFAMVLRTAVLLYFALFRPISSSRLHMAACFTRGAVILRGHLPPLYLRQPSVCFMFYS